MAEGKLNHLTDLCKLLSASTHVFVADVRGPVKVCVGGEELPLLDIKRTHTSHPDFIFYTSLLLMLWMAAGNY